MEKKMETTGIIGVYKDYIRITRPSHGSPTQHKHDNGKLEATIV